MSGPSPVLAEKGDALIRERASATPLRSRARREHAPAKPPTVACEVDVVRAPLATLEEWFVSVTTHRESVSAGIASAPLGAALGVRNEADVERVLTRGPRMSADERIDIYRAGYRMRLVECLADDYPALQHALGTETFESLCDAYIEAHPSRGPSLNVFGRFMPSFCRGRSEPWKDFAADLAALEWGMVEIIHAPPAPVLSLDELARIPPEQWGDARLPPSETLRVLRFDYPVNAYFQAFREGKEPSAIPERTPSATAIYRRGYVVWRMDLTQPMAALLDALAGGATLGSALESIAASTIDADALAEAERDVMVWFREWVIGGFFARVEI